MFTAARSSSMDVAERDKRMYGQRTINVLRKCTNRPSHIRASLEEGRGSMGNGWKMRIGESGEWRM